MIPVLLATFLAAGTAAPARPAAAPSLDMVPPFIGACMANGPDAARIRATVLKAGGKPAPQQADKAASDPRRLEAYLFDNQGVPYSVIFDQAGLCTIVAGRADIAATRESLDRLVIGSSKVFDIHQNEPKPHTAGETVEVEYKLTSKNRKGGLVLTLSRVTEAGKGTAIFLTRRVFNQ